ncbi:hypothetical protein [uncultured Winogradskyella sp.]|uniref:hypothetical protein n=1 Tax=uncultured Winogradskyella sp. TaxID=395353 RepID=UPI00262DEDEC|nr:hypothetical protein [uncultured Winogradskyella sp.]
MKIFNILRKTALIAFISIISVFGTSTSLSCEVLCDALALADLTIPVIADAFDQNGNPIIDPNTGQKIQAINELFFNQRTQEFFNSENPPNQGLLVGDVIQMATSVYNEFSETDCESGALASPTATDAKLSVSGSPYPELNGTFQLNSMPTPTINYGSKAFTSTIFQLATPGYYAVNMDANKGRTIPEHSYDNNFYVGDQGNYSRGNSYLFYVEDNLDGKNITKLSSYKRNDLAPKTFEEVKALEIYKFLHSEAYKEWILEKYKS